MLEIPVAGFARSRNEHNGDLAIQADWIEASLLFGDTPVSRSDIVDALIENYSYEEQDFANIWVDILFSELDRRFALLGNGGAIRRDAGRLTRERDWRERPAYAFCVALAVLPHYRQQVESVCGASYVEQGSLFERLCAESLRASNWHVHEVGWSKAASQSLKSKVQDLSSALGEPHIDGAVTKWAAPHAKDGGLDLVAWSPYPDGWGGRPICLVQCASGDDWKDKLYTPNIALWCKLVDFATRPRTALAMPFAPEADLFRRSSNIDTLMLLLDRHRLLLPSRSGGASAFPSVSLSQDLIAWTKVRAGALPVDSH